MNIIIQYDISEINAKDNKGYTALFYAVNCDKGENSDIVL